MGRCGAWQGVGEAGSRCACWCPQATDEADGIQFVNDPHAEQVPLQQLVRRTRIFCVCASVRACVCVCACCAGETDCQAQPAALVFAWFVHVVRVVRTLSNQLTAVLPHHAPVLLSQCNFITSKLAVLRPCAQARAHHTRGKSCGLLCVTQHSCAREDRLTWTYV